MHPRLKPYSRYDADGQIYLIQEPGVEITLEDADGQIGGLLSLLDGSRSLEAITACLRQSNAELTGNDVADVIAALDEVGLLEDADAAPVLPVDEANRYQSNLHFFGTYASLAKSRQAYQAALRHARVVLLGVGGIGSVVLQNLAGLGVGRITAVDCDRVEVKNLVRQFLYTEADVGRSKLECAAERIRAVNAGVKVEAVERRILSPADVAPLLEGADLVISAIDTPAEAPHWVNEACVKAGVPLIAGGFYATRGVYYSVAPGKSGCLACYQRLQTSGDVQVREAPRINRGTGPSASLVGALITWEAVRFLTGFAAPVAEGRLMLVDFTTGTVTCGMEWERQPDCPVCAKGVER